MLAFILIILGVFIYNLRQPYTAKKKEDTETETAREDGESRDDRTRSLRSRLRGFILESRTFELSESRRTHSTKTGSASAKGGAKVYGTVDNGGTSKKVKRASASESESDSLLVEKK